MSSDCFEKHTVVKTNECYENICLLKSELKNIFRLYSFLTDEQKDKIVTELLWNEQFVESILLSKADLTETETDQKVFLNDITENIAHSIYHHVYGVSKVKDGHSNLDWECAKKILEEKKVVNTIILNYSNVVDFYNRMISFTSSASLYFEHLDMNSIWYLCKEIIYVYNKQSSKVYLKKLKNFKLNLDKFNFNNLDKDDIFMNHLNHLNGLYLNDEILPNENQFFVLNIDEIYTYRFVGLNSDQYEIKDYFPNNKEIVKELIGIFNKFNLNESQIKKLVNNIFWDKRFLSIYFKNYTYTNKEYMNVDGAKMIYEHLSKFIHIEDDASVYYAFLNILSNKKLLNSLVISSIDIYDYYKHMRRISFFINKSQNTSDLCIWYLTEKIIERCIVENNIQHAYEVFNSLFVEDVDKNWFNSTLDHLISLRNTTEIDLNSVRQLMNTKIKTDISIL